MANTKVNKPKNWSFAVLLLGILALGICAILPHCWLVVPSGQVIYNGQPSPGSKLYRSLGGDLVLKLSQANEPIYRLFPSSKIVSCANGANFSFYSRVAVVTHNDQAGVDLDDTEKTGIHPHVVSGRNFIEFTGLRKRHIRAIW